MLPFASLDSALPRLSLFLDVGVNHGRIVSNAMIRTAMIVPLSPPIPVINTTYVSLSVCLSLVVAVVEDGLKMHSGPVNRFHMPKIKDKPNDDSDPPCYTYESTVPLPSCSDLGAPTLLRSLPAASFCFVGQSRSHDLGVTVIRSHAKSDASCKGVEEAAHRHDGPQ